MMNNDEQEQEQTCMNFSFTDLTTSDVMKIIDGIRYMIAQSGKLIDSESGNNLRPQDRELLISTRNTLFPLEKKLVNQAVDQREKCQGADRITAEIILGKYKRL